MIDWLGFLMSGIMLGLVAGVSPGPLMALVISETVRHSRREGITVAIVPILTDLPVVAVSLYVLGRLASSDWVLGIVSVCGAGFLGYLAYESITTKVADLQVQGAKVQSLRKGIITNLLSPNPYLFWMVIGAPTVLKAYQINLLSAVLFICGFYLLLVGSKIVIAVIVDKSKQFIKSNGYLWLVRSLGLILLIFAGLFIRDGLRLLGAI